MSDTASLPGTGAPDRIRFPAATSGRYPLAFARTMETE